MSKKFRIFILSAIIVSLMASPLALSANKAHASTSAEPSASSSIYFYRQLTYTNIFFPDGHTLKGYGCGLFCYAHAYQKLLCDKKNSSNCEALLNELKQNGCSYDAGLNNYDNYLRNLGCTSVATSKLSSTSGILNHFDNGGVAIINIPGHYILAVGAEECDIDGNGTNEVWLHIVDSSPQSTFWRMNQRYYAYPYTFDKHSKIYGYQYNENTKTYTNGYYNGNICSFWDGGEYWISYNDFAKCSLTWMRAYLPGTLSEASTLTFSNVSYPKEYKISSSGYWISSGALMSDYDLTSITTEIRNSSGSLVSGPTTHSLSGKYASIAGVLDTGTTTDNGVKFSKISSAGNYTWILTAKDSAGRTLTLEMPFTAKTSGSTVESTASLSFGDTTSSSSYLDVNGWLNGVLSDSLENYGTCDVYINGSLVADDVNDYYSQWPVGTKFEIKDIRATSAFAYNGVYSGSLSGTIGSDTQRIVLDFERPTKPVVTVTPGDTYNATVFSWGTTDYTTHYDVRIYNSSGISIWSSNGDNDAYRTQTSDKLKYAALLAPGNYSVTIAASNQIKNSWYISDKVSFTVASASAPSAGTHIAQAEGNHHLYKVIKKSCTWLEAEYLASNANGNLATITSSTEQSVVAALVKQAGFDCWLGAERYRKDAWAWITGESFGGYTNWTDSEPNNQNGQENVLEMSYATGKWNDTSCISTNKGAGYVVEFNPTSLSISTKHGYYLSDKKLTKSDLTVKVTFADGTTLTTSDYEISAQSYTNKSFTITVRYGNLTASCNANGIEAVSLGDDFYAVIRHIDSGKLVDSESITKYANTYLTTEAFSDKQLWHFVRQPEGYYKIYQGEYLMELQGGYTDDHTQIRLYTENNNSAQWWYIQKNGSGYRLTSVKKPSSCVDVAGNNSADGTKIQLFGEHDKEGSQTFAIEKCIPASGIALNCSFTVQDRIGSSTLLTAELIPADTTYQNVLWSSSDPSVATVSESGMVTVTGSGITTIICRTVDEAYQADCIVAAYGDNALRLPAGLKRIETEAFMSLPVEAIVLPENIKVIEAKAFADCASLELIYMPDSLTQIAEDAFDGCTPTFICATYNDAAAYAEAHSIPYLVIAY